ncbi:MAG: nucleotidyltransferase domain-containing protein [Elusimicrobiota bacterium]|nr:nucleotidyltransferase domain-containing protein [Elusimicrobiota bacterium]
MTNKEAEKWAIKETKRITLSILKGQNIKTWLFGSRATGKNRKFSDIDIALDAGKKGVSRDLMARLSFSFEESHIPFKVDILDMRYASNAVCERIRKEGEIWID